MTLDPVLVSVGAARVDQAPEIAALVRRSFAARPPLDPPAPALTETTESIATALAADGGLVVELNGRIIGSLLFDRSRAGQLGLCRVAVDPGEQAHGIASAMVGVAESMAADEGFDSVWLRVRDELPQTVRFWMRRGYHQIERDGVHSVVAKAVPVTTVVGSPEAMHELAGRLATVLHAGDVLILSGELGAGKTTFTQGLADALGVRGPVTSPTFVLARIHPSLVGGPALVHVDAYRLASPDEVDDLDLDATVADSITVIEWGHDKAEQLADSWLELSIASDPLVGDAEPARRVAIAAHGSRWAGVSLRAALNA